VILGSPTPEENSQSAMLWIMKRMIWCFVVVLKILVLA